MLTLILAIAHSRSKNENFRPDFLYFGTFIIDFVAVITIGEIFGC